MQLLRAASPAPAALFREYDAIGRGCGPLVNEERASGGVSFWKACSDPNVKNPDKQTFNARH
jgi:hypothetical protein